jgi:hypothetical protein
MVIRSFVRRFSLVSNLNNYPDAVIVIDYLNNIKHWNQLASDIFGYTEAEIKGRNIALLFDNEAEKIYKCIKDNSTQVIAAKNYTDYDIYVEISCKDLKKHQLIFITARDVTRNQKVIEKLLIEYEKASKISQNKSLFIASLSNNLKSPVHSVIGFSQGLIDGICGELNEKQLKYVSIINKNANSLLDVVDNLLDLSKMETDLVEADMKVFDVIRTIGVISDKIRIKAEKKNLQFDVDLNDIVKKNIYSDENMLSRVILNVLENAVKFTEMGSIRLKAIHPDIETVKNLGLEINFEFTDKSFLLFSVTDTGIGISEEEITGIFDEYHQTDRNMAKKYGGTGLQLAITKKILALLGGVIWVESEIGQGSTFNFIIPIERIKQKTEKEPALNTEQD